VCTEIRAKEKQVPTSLTDTLVEEHAGLVTGQRSGATGSLRKVISPPVGNEDPRGSAETAGVRPKVCTASRL
jgi:hypothetical protein